MILNQAIYFGASLYHSLINPNQIRHFGMPVSGNPYDSGRDFGINHEDKFITFKTEGSTVFLKYFVPTYAEINTCPHMVLTDSDL